jgi:hypothetical protein
MRFIVLTLLVTTTLSCGEVGIALNVSKEFSVSTTFKYDADTASVNLREELPYSLDDVETFSEYLPKLEEAGTIDFNQLSFQIDSVNEREAEIVINQFSIKVIHEIDTITVLQQNQKTLANIQKEVLPIDTEDLISIRNWLFDRETITTEVIFVINEIPTDLERIEFEFTAFFDATLKARNLGL